MTPPSQPGTATAPASPTAPAPATHSAPAPTAADRVRTLALGASAAALVLVPTLGPLLAGTEEGAEEYDTEITPPDYAFAIWAPIFAGTAANAIQHAARPTAAVNRRTGWWLAGAYAANACWSVAAQSDRFRYTPFILPIATGLAAVAYRNAQDVPLRGAEHLAAHSTGLLLGWTGLASVINVFAAQRHGRLASTSPAERSAARLAAAGAAGALSAAVATSRHGYASLAAAGAWGLVTSAAHPERTAATRRISAAGAALIAGTTVIKLWTSRPPRTFH
jgi:hypothetical protein